MNDDLFRRVFGIAAAASVIACIAGCATNVNVASDMGSTGTGDGGAGGAGGAGGSGGAVTCTPQPEDPDAGFQRKMPTHLRQAA